jgi:hypothetical protein
VLLDVGLNLGGYQNRTLGAVLILCAVILVLFPLFIKLMKMAWDALKYLYEILGANHPRLSLIIVAAVGGILGITIFGSLWWFAGQAYRAEQTKEKPPIAGRPSSDDPNISALGFGRTARGSITGFIMKNTKNSIIRDSTVEFDQPVSDVPVIGFQIENSDESLMERNRLSILSGSHPLGEQELEKSIQEIVAALQKLPFKEQGRCSVIVQREIDKVRGKPDAAAQLKAAIQKELPEINPTPPPSTPNK